MATPYSAIFELLLASIEDYRINKMNTQDIEIYLTTFLIRAIPNFKNCRKDLELRDDTALQFNIDLTTDEKVILSNLMRVEWLTREINDLSQMRLHLQDGDFKTFSEERGLNGKRENLKDTLELVNKQMTDYSYKYINWSDLR